MSISPLTPRDSQPVAPTRRTQVPASTLRAEGVEAIEHSYAQQRAEALKVVKDLEINPDRPDMLEWMQHLDDKPTMDEVINGLANLLALGEESS